MELRQIKDLMAAMGKTGTKRLRLKLDNVELELEQLDPHAGEVRIVESLPAPAQHLEARNPKAALSAGAKGLEGNKGLRGQEGSEEVDGTSAFVTSPMVGVFYPTPSPDDPPFVNVGERVSPETVICIVEAMKVMNEVKAGVSGTLKEVLVDRGHPVEFGTKLFRIIPD